MIGNGSDGPTWAAAAEFESNFTSYVLQRKSDKWTETCFNYLKCMWTRHTWLFQLSDDSQSSDFKDTAKEHASSIWDVKTGGFLFQSTRDGWSEESALLQLSADHQRHGEWKRPHIIPILILP